MSIVQHTSCPVCDSEKLSDYFVANDYFLSKEDFPLVKCDNCSFILTQNAPSQDTIGKYYESEDYISHSDNSKGLVFKLYHWARSMMLNLKLKMVESIQPQPGKMLDIGSGTGYFLNHAKSYGWQVQGIEQDDKARNYSIEQFKCEVNQPSKLNDFNAESFDAITMWHVLEHVHDLNGYLNTIHSILKNNGVFVVAVPNPTSKDQEIYGKYWAAWDVPRHIWHFTPNSMKTLMEKHGFNIKKLKRMPFDPFYIALMSEKYKGGSQLKGFINGGLSFISALFNRKKCSSLVYIITKK